jgi:hypothetical protein
LLPENADDGVRGLTVDGIHDAGWSPAAGHIGPAAREPWPLSPAAEPELAALTEVFARRGLWPDEGTLVHELRREAERLLPCDRAIVALCGRGYLQIFERSEGRESFVLPHGPQTLPWQACRLR